MKRRRAIALAGLTGLTGCLQMQEEFDDSDPEDSSDEDELETEDDENLDGESEANEDGATDDGLFVTREEAIEYVAEIATDDTIELYQYDGDGSDGIAFSVGSGGSSAGTAPDDSVYSASSIDVQPTAEDRIAFGGDTGRSLRVRDLALETTATFTPDSDADAVNARRIKVNTTGGGELREDDTPTFYGVDDVVSLPGEWTGDVEMFGELPFGEYVVSILEDDEVVAETAGGIHGIGYRWRFEQTADTMFITRHASVREDWIAEVMIGDETLPAIHRPDLGVFEIDLAESGLESGRYDWTLELHEGDGGDWYRAYLSMRNSFGPELLIL